MIIKQALPGEENDVAALALKMWPEHEADELRRLFAALLKAPDAAVLSPGTVGLPWGLPKLSCGGIMSKERPNLRWDTWKEFMLKKNSGAGALRAVYWQNVKTGAETGDVRNLRATADWITLTV